MNDSASDAIRAEWSYLEDFRLEIRTPTNKLFGNWRQSVAIDVIVDARASNGDVVQLTRAQLESIQLIDYVGGSPFPDWGAHWGVHPYNYYPQFDHFPADGAVPISDAKAGEDSTEPEITPADRAFQEYEAKRIALEQERARLLSQYGIDLTTNGVDREVIVDDPSSTQPTAQSITFYVVASQHALKQRFAARIPRPGGGFITTNNPNRPGEFDSSVEVEVIKPRQYYASSFDLDREDAYSDRYFDLDLYYIYLKNGLKIKEVYLTNMMPEFPGCYYRWHKSGHFKTQWAWPGGAPSRVTIQRGVAGPELTFTINQYFQSHGKATAARLSFLTWSGDVSRSAAARANFRDQYGNEHSVWITHSSDGNKVLISDSP